MRKIQTIGALVTIGTLVGLGAAACSSDSTSATATDAGSGNDGATGTDSSASDGSTSDGSTSDAASDAPNDSGVSCSGVATGGAILQFFPSGIFTAAPDITWSTCSTKATISPPAGSPFQTWKLDVGAGVGYYRTSATGYKTSLTPFLDSSIAAAASPNLFLQIVKDVTGYSAAKANVIVSLGTANTPCMKAGSTVTAPGHAEATITYVDKNGADVGGAMTNDGLAIITNLDPAVSPTLEPLIAPTPSTCKISFTFTTGKLPLVVDTVAILNAESKP